MGFAVVMMGELSAMLTKHNFATIIVLMGVMCSGMTAFPSLRAGQPAPHAPSLDEKVKDDKRKEKKTYAQPDEKDEKMFPDGRDHDFGKVPTGTLCKHVFRIVNLSDTPIRIGDVRSSMNPSRWNYVGHLDLQPKEEGTLDVCVDTRNFHGAKVMAGYLTVETNKGFKEFRFYIKAESDPSQNR